MVHVRYSDSSDRFTHVHIYLLVAQCFVCPGVQNDCRTWAHVCQSCQSSKVSRHTVAIGRLCTSGSPFSPCARRPRGTPSDISWLDILPLARSCPHSRITANTVACALLTCWISCFSCPQTITTGQGCQFKS
jgi:hypothetical protein